MSSSTAALRLSDPLWQGNSTLWTKLPYDIRMLIYTELFGRRFVHLRRYGHDAPWRAAICPRRGSQVSHKDCEHPRTNPWRDPDMDLSTAMLYTCKASYQEGIDVLYQRNRFSFNFIETGPMEISTWHAHLPNNLFAMPYPQSFLHQKYQIDYIMRTAKMPEGLNYQELAFQGYEESATITRRVMAGVREDIFDAVAEFAAGRFVVDVTTTQTLSLNIFTHEVLFSMWLLQSTDRVGHLDQTDVNRCISEPLKLIMYNATHQNPQPYMAVPHPALGPSSYNPAPGPITTNLGHGLFAPNPGPGLFAPNPAPGPAAP